MEDEDGRAAAGRRNSTPGACLMPFPSPSLPAPSLTVGQMSYGGLVFGGLTKYVPATPYGQNLVLNPGAEYGLAGVATAHTVGIGSVARSLHGPAVGLWCVEGRTEAIPNQGLSFALGPVPAGDYLCQMRIRGTPGAVFQLFADNLANEASPVQIVTLGASSGVYQTVTWAWTPEENSTSPVLVVRHEPASVTQFFIDALVVQAKQPNIRVPEYFDGDTPGYHWTGEPGNSVSESNPEIYTSYSLQSVEGLGPPDTLSGDLQRAQDEGEFAGLDELPGRDLTIVQVISGQTGAQLAEARMQFAGVLGVKGATEEPLYIQTEVGTFACMARPRKHHFPWDINAFLAKGVVATTLFHATDPRWYSVPTKTATVGLPSGPSSGASFPISFPVSFGGGTAGGILQVRNNGKFEMRPVLVFTGPCKNPKAANLSIEGAPSIQVNINLNAGDTLTVDMDFQTIQYIVAGGHIPSSRRFDLAPGSTWWNLPGESLSQIEFSTSDSSAVAGTLTVQSGDAFTGL
jgi:hypothetical protein